MAAEPSVSDVLCEAMEYLSKLGSNLKTRTDNLKAKKIRKDKLRNSHAIHKAANKVLLICELSKRSLENVEKGVRNILSKEDTEQTSSSFGGKTDDSKNIEFQQFKYCSRTLRICKTVPIKHYMSVKVRARNMSLSMHDKYPVYYNCKLYRMRKKSMKKSIEQLPTGVENEISEIPNVVQNENSCIDNASNSNTLNFLSCNESTSHNESVEVPQNSQMKSNFLDDSLNSMQTVNLSETSSLEPIDNNKDNGHDLVMQNIKELDKQKLENTNEETTFTNLKSETCKPAKSNNETIKKKLANESDSSDEEQITVRANIRSKKKKSAKILNDSSDDNENIQTNDTNTKLSTEISRGENSTVNVNSELSRERTKMSVSKSEEENDIITEQVIIDSNIQPVAETNKTCSDTEQAGESTIPQIKCVNIFKLLKPDIANTLHNKSDKSKTSVKHSQDKIHKNINTTNLQNVPINSLEESKEKEFLNEKRKEILAFKPKNCSIKLHKLSCLSKELLHKYKLKKITHNGSVLCQLDLLNEQIKEAQKVKNDLLNDSDSDDVTTKRLSIDGRKLKYALLYDSDSDSQETNNKSYSKPERSNGDKNIEAEAEKIDNENKKKSDEDVSNSYSSKQKSTMTVINSNCTENISPENMEISSLFKSPGDDILHTENINDSMHREISNFSKEGIESENETENMLVETSNKDSHTSVINNTDEPTSKSIRDNKDISSSNNTPINRVESNSCTTSLTLDYQKSTDNNTYKSSDKTNCFNKEIDLASENTKSQNELHCTDGDKNATDENEKLKDALLCESHSDDNHIPPRYINNFKGIKRKLSLNVINNSKSTKDSEVSSEIDNHKSSLLHCSDSDDTETNELSSKTNDGNNSPGIECSSKSNKTNIEEPNASDDKVDSDVHENETKKELSPNKIKSSLLNSSDDSQNNTTKSISRAKLRRKRIRERIKAKKMLMTNSSSSDDDDVPRHKKIKDNNEIDNLITEITDEIEDMKREQRKIGNVSSSSGSSGEDLLGSVKNKKHLKSKGKINSSDGESKGSQSADQECLKVGDKCHEHSDSSSGQMVRSKSKPGTSISHNSDTQDDRDVDRLTNLESLEKPRPRRGSTSSFNTEETITTKKREKMPKGPSLIGEELLNAESSLESNPEDENVEAEEEDLPEIILPVVNNGIGHISKDDLLGDSDSSVSHNSKEGENTQDDSEEENVKSKRRKGNTISSDSEAGASRKKDRDVKLSDFEDSDDSSEPTKRTKRTKKATDSDASNSSTDANKKKRRRIKQMNDSDMSDSDGETEGRNKHGRKNIRKVMGKNQLEEATKKAAREEKERIARIAERQKVYNNMEFDESGKPDEVVLEKVVLDFDPETKEPLIEVDRGLVKKLKPHQANGIKFMWDACFESVKRIKKDKGSGCILAHCMGLGKTLQVISLTHTLLTHGSLTGVNRVLVVCPLSTVLNWVNEFRMWLKHAESEFEVDVYELSKNKQNIERASQLNQWFQGGGVCVLGYEMFRNLSADNNKKFKKKMLKSFQESLVDPGPDLVVCDEGHLLKNEKTSLSQSMNRVKTLRRIVLTGTPLQNNLKEYYCMVQFVKPNLLGKYNEYLNRFVNPITNGQYTDSTEHDIRVMKRRSHVLHKMLDGAVQRRDYGVLAPFLPPKHEYVLFITLSDVQIKLYETYLENYSRRPQPGKSSGFLFPDFQSLQRIWTHPLVLKYNSERYEIMQQKKREREEDDSEGSLADFIDDDSTSEETSTEESTDVSSDMSDDSRKKSKKKKSSKKGKGKDKVSTRRGTRANPVSVEQDEEDPIGSDVVEVKYENPTEWWIKLVSEDELEDIRNSHKLVLLFDILRQCETIGDKLLVFSQSLYSLDLIEHFLGKVDEATQEGRMDEKLGGHFGSWSPGIDYFRLDGSTSCENRSIWCKNFNREDNPRARLFLISTRAGGLGINLVAANRVVIFDVSWNPSHDVQSIFRVYRFGQKKPCYVYRFLAMGTMEEKIYERQVTKQAISKRVIDEQQIDRHYAENDLAELYKFEPKPAEPRELPALPKDRLFAEMLREHEAQIYKYHEHDSLLENKEEETLTEEERKAAWEDFENEKNRPPPAPFPTAWPMHNGMMPNLYAQQQQAYAMLAAMMGKDASNINDNQLRDVLPLLYNTPGMFGGYDYGMMQKMNNYKYAQPGMMNPMMASVMNQAAGSGMGGTSGLQYEPPWQRQHQQQMRLQQLMQQQNSMGAKYYAGGLGSRDPVAMALQQQRAREIMLGGGGGGAAGGGASAGVSVLPISGPVSRPRGRPPIRGRTTTPTGPADVVNLDSD